MDAGRKQKLNGDARTVSALSLATLSLSQHQHSLSTEYRFIISHKTPRWDPYPNSISRQQRQAKDHGLFHPTYVDACRNTSYVAPRPSSRQQSNSCNESALFLHRHFVRGSHGKRPVFQPEKREEISSAPFPTPGESWKLLSNMSTSTFDIKNTMVSNCCSPGSPQTPPKTSGVWGHGSIQV